jgi:hypothetical protein
MFSHCLDDFKETLSLVVSISATRFRPAIVGLFCGILILEILVGIPTIGWVGGVGIPGFSRSVRIFKSVTNVCVCERE